MTIRTPITIEEFEKFAQRTENTGKRFELVDGEILEVPSNPFVSVIANLISFYIRLFLKNNDLPGHVTGEGGGFIIDGQVLAPDVAFVRDLPTNKGYEQTPPLLAVEVLSDPTSSTEQTDLRRKLAHYRNAGVIAWVVDYIARTVEVHLPDNTVTVYDEQGTLTGGDALPDFQLAVSEIFPDEVK